MKLFLISISIAIISILSIQDTNAIYYNYCDKVWSEMHFSDTLTPELEKLCRNRFIYHVNREKRIMYLNYQTKLDNLYKK